MLLNRAWIERHIPHQGRMCLIDEVMEWDVLRIRCRSATHRAPDNPLRSQHRLGVACGIEYAAQAMALHGALAAERTARPEAGILASVRGVRLYAERLDDIESDLVCEVALIAGDHLTALYEFALHDDRRCLLSGRATVVLDAGTRLRL